MRKKIKRIASVLIFCILFVCCGKCFQFILIDDTTSYTRITFHEMYEQDNIDVLFVGSSHCYRSFVPEILDEELCVNTFNAGTSSQKLDGSYMVIKEAARYNNLQHVYLEIYYSCAFDVFEHRTQLTQTYIISDYLRPSIDKIMYLINASGMEHYVNSFILARRNWSKFFDANYVKDLVIKKGTDEYKNYDYTYITSDTEWYAGKGYVANNSIINDWNYFSTSGWDRIELDHVSDDWLNTLLDILEFCDKKGIELTLIAAPMPNFLLAGAGNYDDYINLVENLIAGTNVNYYDFNLCREEYFSNTSSLFMDTNHMNCYGAETFSNSFARLMNGDVSEEEMFYGSYQEKMENVEPTVFGISYHDDNAEDGTVVRNCKIVSSDMEGMEYRITIMPPEEKPYMIQEFSENMNFTLSPEEKGTCVIRYRMKDIPNAEYEVQISIPS